MFLKACASLPQINLFQIRNFREVHRIKHKKYNDMHVKYYEEVSNTSLSLSDFIIIAVKLNPTYYYNMIKDYQLNLFLKCSHLVWYSLYLIYHLLGNYNSVYRLYLIGEIKDYIVSIFKNIHTLKFSADIDFNDIEQLKFLHSILNFSRNIIRNFPSNIKIYTAYYQETMKFENHNLKQLNLVSFKTDFHINIRKINVYGIYNFIVCKIEN